MRTSGKELLPVTAEGAYVLLLQFRGGGLGVVNLVATARHERGDVIELYGDRGRCASTPTGACGGAGPARSFSARVRSTTARRRHSNVLRSSSGPPFETETLQSPRSRRRCGSRRSSTRPTSPMSSAAGSIPNRSGGRRLPRRDTGRPDELRHREL